RASAARRISMQRIRRPRQQRPARNSGAAGGRCGRRPLDHPRGNAKPKGPCVIGRPAVIASTRNARKESALLTQDWHPRLHACISPGMVERTPPTSRASEKKNGAHCCVRREDNGPTGGRPVQGSFFLVLCRGAVRNGGIRRSFMLRGPFVGDISGGHSGGEDCRFE